MPAKISKRRKAIGERLGNERERLGYTQRQIAQLLGVTEKAYAEMELGETDPGLFAMPHLNACGFDVNFIITGERIKPIQDECELLRRFRDLSMRGRNSVFMTLDALERLAPNLKTNIQSNLRTNIDRIVPNIGENIRTNIERIAPNISENIRSNIEKIEKIAPNISENIGSNIRNIKKKLKIH